MAKAPGTKPRFKNIDVHFRLTVNESRKQSSPDEKHWLCLDPVSQRLNKSSFLQWHVVSRWKLTVIRRVYSDFQFWNSSFFFLSFYSSLEYEQPFAMWQMVGVITIIRGNAVFPTRRDRKPQRTKSCWEVGEGKKRKGKKEGEKKENNAYDNSEPDNERLGDPSPRAHLPLDQSEPPHRFFPSRFFRLIRLFPIHRRRPFHGPAITTGDARCKTWPSHLLLPLEPVEAGKPSFCRSEHRWKRLFKCFQVARRFLKFTVNGSVARHPVKA